MIKQYLDRPLNLIW